jgi:cob(I)alamin adenosyltransferase
VPFSLLHDYVRHLSITLATRIYTRTGDSGETGLFGGQRVSKDDPRVEAYGAVDELNSVVGVAVTHSVEPDLTSILQRIQNDLFALGADLATPPEAGETHGRATVTRVTAEKAAALEPVIDRLESEVPALNQFILPGGTPLGAHLHLARAVCRRAERRCVTLAGTDAVNPEVVRYLNRLSDLLFVMARVANFRQGAPDVAWTG